MFKHYFSACLYETARISAFKHFHFLIHQNKYLHRIESSMIVTIASFLKTAHPSYQFAVIYSFELLNLKDTTKEKRTGQALIFTR